MNAEEKPADRLKKATDTGAGDDVEHDVWSGGYSGKAMIGSWIGAGIGSIVLLVGATQLGDFGYKWAIVGVLIAVLWLGLAGLLAYRKLSVRYELSDQRFVHSEGILARTVNRIELIDIDDVTYKQGLVERMVSVGSIKIESSDRSHPEFWMLGIENVKEIADMIDDLRRKERRRRGLHIEAV